MAGGGEQVAVVADLRSGDGGAVAEAPHHLAGGGAPQPGEAVTAGGEDAGVIEEDGAGDLLGVGERRKLGGAGGDAPQPRRALLSEGEEGLAVGGEPDGVQVSRVGVGERRRQRLAGGNVPDAGVVGVEGGGGQGTLAAQRDVADLAIRGAARGVAGWDGERSDDVDGSSQRGASVRGSDDEPAVPVAGEHALAVGGEGDAPDAGAAGRRHRGHQLAVLGAPQPGAVVEGGEARAIRAHDEAPR